MLRLVHDMRPLFCTRSTCPTFPTLVTVLRPGGIVLEKHVYQHVTLCTMLLDLRIRAVSDILKSAGAEVHL